MHAELLVPLSALPGFDVLGLPVHVLTPDDDRWHKAVRFDATDFGRRPIPVWVVLISVYEGVAPSRFLMEQTSVVDERLDFADASTRDRACRWAASRAMDEHGAGCTAEGGCTWHGRPGAKWRNPGENRDRYIPGERRWHLAGPLQISASAFFVADARQIPLRGASGHHPDSDPAGTVPDPEYLVVPALGALDPEDDTRLSDGSRLVDALALTHTCRFLGAR